LSVFADAALLSDFVASDFPVSDWPLPVFPPDVELSPAPFFA
jgi:hypothetical protein